MRFQGLQILESQPQTIVSLNDALAQLHLDAGFDDDKVQTCIDSAVMFVEGYMWRSYRQQTIQAIYSIDGYDYAELMRGDFGELVSVQFFDGSLQTIDIGSVIVDPTLPIARAYFTEPTVNGDYFAPVKITYTTQAPAVVPAQIKQAMLIATAQFYDDRDAPDMSSVQRILDIFKTRYFL